MIQIDHVILVVTDLTTAARHLLDRHGLASVEGGRHPGHGTANRIVPLGDSYLELMGFVDEAEAAASPMGRWALEHHHSELVPVAVCLRTDDIETAAAALGEAPLTMHRVRTDGMRLSWRLVGLDGMLGPQSLPFFIQWEGAAEDHPGATTAPHLVAPSGIAEVVIGPVSDPIARLISAVPGVRIAHGHPGVHLVMIPTDSGRIVLKG